MNNFIWVMLFSTVFGYTSGSVEGWKLEDYMFHQHQLSERWHNVQFIDRVTGVGTGITIALDSKFKVKDIAKDLLVSASLFWVSHDIGYNSARGFNWFRVSNQSGWIMEKYGHIWFKLLFVATALIIKYIF